MRHVVQGSAQRRVPASRKSIRVKPDEVAAHCVVSAALTNAAKHAHATAGQGTELLIEVPLEVQSLAA
jgi:anti-sigma regulatory factor (Ser/Thr protein kinase)